MSREPRKKGHLKQFPELELIESEEQRREVIKEHDRQANREWVFWAIALTVPLVMYFTIRAAIVTLTNLNRIWAEWLTVAVILVTWVPFAFATYRRSRQAFIRKKLTELGTPVCRKCGYALVGQTEPRCPECGEPFDPELSRKSPPSP